MDDFEKEWTLESALEVLRHPTVDSRIWAEAVEWLLVYGPPDIREKLLEASGYATSREFPDLRPQGFTSDGEPVYSVAEVAKALGISEEEAAEIIAEKQARHGKRHLFDPRETRKVQ
ncbi:MAG: hypothetical protein Kow0089_17450 [Desulfobulbaceae bacterium]